MNRMTPASQPTPGPAPADNRAAASEDCVAWEELENGRFRPRRVRGSCLGMELG